MRVPLAQPRRFATRFVDAREYLLVWIDTQGGVTGCGHAYAGTTGGRVLRDVVVDLLRPQLVGQDCARIESLWSRLYQETLLLGRRGAVLRALSAVDIALWDVRALGANRPLHRVLGATVDAVHAYASGGYYFDGDPLVNVEREMARNVERGFDAAKMKVGGADVTTDVERVRVARETIAPKRRLALDANNAWKAPAEAIAFARAVERYDPWWLEEPLSPDDVRGHAEIARALDWPVATGEIHATRWEFRELIAQHAADILQPDASVLGGVSEWLAVAEEARAAGVPVAPHWDANLHVHLAAAAGALTVEHFSLDIDVYNFERLVLPESRLEPRDSRIPLPTRPGVGIALDMDAVERLRIA